MVQTQELLGSNTSSKCLQIYIYILQELHMCGPTSGWKDNDLMAASKEDIRV